MGSFKASRNQKLFLFVLLFIGYEVFSWPTLWPKQLLLEGSSTVIWFSMVDVVLSLSIILIKIALVVISSYYYRSVFKVGQI